MCDAFLTLAQTEPGLVLLPRAALAARRHAQRVPHPAPEGQARQPLATPRARSSIDGTWARMVGEEGRGVATIIEMVHHTRLDCVIGSAGHHAPRASRRRCTTRAHRSAFGRRLVDQPLMQNVLADLALESRGGDRARCCASRARTTRRRATRTRAPSRASRRRSRSTGSASARRARGLRGDGVPRRQRLRRGVDPAAALPRGAASNAIWEGIGQRDLPRRAARDRARARGAAGAPGRAAPRARRPTAASTPSCAALEARPRRSADAESRARTLVERLALALQASILLRAAPSVGEAFCAARLAEHPGLTFGALPSGIPRRALVSRILPL